VKVPSKTRLHDTQINIQAAIGNAYGCVDNLAWVWVHERGMAQSIDRRHVGLRKHNKQVRSTLSAELRTYLDSLEGWFDYLVDYRDALAHRIPVYIPPGCVQRKDLVKAKELENRETAALNALRPYEYERLDAAQRATARVSFIHRNAGAIPIPSAVNLRFPYSRATKCTGRPPTPLF